MISFLRGSQMRNGVQIHYFTAAAVISFFLFVIFMSSSRSSSTIRQSFKGTSQQPRDLAANSTLGFEKLLALSLKPSWRTRGLESAARLTGLEFTIPPQPPNPVELIEAFEQIGKDKGAKLPQHGSATAWFAHLDLLKFVIASDFSSAFIVEDDVDWDVDLKYQIQLISDNVRSYTNTPAQDPTPYGTNWDVLWLGHCGSAIDPANTKRLEYSDPTRCKTELYSGWSKHFLRDFMPEGKRWVQDTFMTVCTFGYAVTRESAPKVLKLLAGGANEAFDVSMSSFCKNGDLKCVIVNPQVFNHYEPPKDHGYLSPVHEGDGQGDSAKDSDFEGYMGTTGNIMKSARCKALFNDVCMRPPSEI